MPLNLLFFGCYFCIIAVVHVVHTFLADDPVTSFTYLMALYGLLQAAFETLLFAIVGFFISHRWPKWVNIYAFVMFFLFLGHLIDFPLLRLFDMSFWYALTFVLEENYANFIQLLIATNLPLIFWFLFLSAALAIPFLGILIYRITHNRPIHIAKTPFFIALATCITLLASLDYKLNSSLSFAHLFRMQKTFPWKQTFFYPTQPELTLPAALKSLPSHEECLSSLDSSAFSLLHKPDIYLIIIESLRSDFINEVNTPAINTFKQQNIHFPLTFSNANATQLSWFSLFHSQYPFRWKNPQELREHFGSLPLTLLKKMGYKIHVCSSSHLAYYQMDEVIFGKGQHLADTLFTPDNSHTEPYIRDEMATNHLLSLMQTEGSGRLFILFLDASHFDYSFPSDKARFFPYDSNAHYIQALFSKKVPCSLLNRYQNALSFVDSQVEAVLNAMKYSQDAVVVITGDHGQEFYEKGNLFHNSHLSKEQITPPIFYRFPYLKRKPTCSTTCQMDIFPSLFHYLTGQDIAEPILEGQSIFKKERWPFTVIARFNASRTPTEYCIHSDKFKLTIALDQKDPSVAKKLSLISTKTLEDDTLPFNSSSLEEEFGPAIDHLFPMAP